MLEVKIPFDFYHDGVTKTHYPEGLADIPGDAAEIAVREGWAVMVKEYKEEKPKGKAR